MRVSVAKGPLFGLISALALVLPSWAQTPSGMDHSGHHPMPGMGMPATATPKEATPAHAGHGHGHDVGPAGDTYDLRFIDGMVQHHSGALLMAHDALAKSTNPTIRRFAQAVIVAQRVEIIGLRRMLALEGLRKPEYHNYDALFSP